MTTKFNKDPNKMTLQELFDMQQAMQKESEKQGQHLPMYTKRKPVNGEKPSPENMHEEATRNQLSHLYKQQSQTPEDAAPAEQPHEDEHMAQNLPQQGVNTMGAARDGVGLWSEFEQMKQERNQGRMQQYKNWGMHPDDFRNELDRGNSYGFVGEFDELEEQYKKLYYGK